MLKDYPLYQCLDMHYEFWNVGFSKAAGFVSL